MGHGVSAHEALHDIASCSMQRKMPGHHFRSAQSSFLIAGVEQGSAAVYYPRCKHERFLFTDFGALATNIKAQNSSGLKDLVDKEIGKIDKKEADSAASETMKASMKELQDDIDKLTKEWEQGFDNMHDKFNQASDKKNALDEAWKQYRGELEGSCEDLRSKLERLSEARAMCKEAQNDLENGMPALFTKRAEDPERFKRMHDGKIQGCDAGDGSVSEPTDCSCPNGNEATGCQDAKDMTGHELRCTKIFDFVTKQLRMDQEGGYFRHGGKCKVAEDEKFADELVPPDTWKM